MTAYFMPSSSAVKVQLILIYTTFKIIIFDKFSLKI